MEISNIECSTGGLNWRTVHNIVGNDSLLFSCDFIRLEMTLEVNRNTHLDYIYKFINSICICFMQFWSFLIDPYLYSDVMNVPNFKKCVLVYVVFVFSKKPESSLCEKSH